MATVAFRNLSKSFGPVEVFKGIDLDIADGEFVVFVGPSGCGKSTLLRMIAGLEDVTDGELRIDGRLVNEVQPKDRRVAMVFQTYAIFPHMSVRENIGFGLTIAGAPKAEKETRVREAARILRMEHLLDRRPAQLSGGQRQRVAIGRAIVRDPSVFLFDEPLSNLDAALRLDMRMEIAKLHKTLGATMVYVTHDQVEAMTLADRIAVLSDGAVQQIGPPMDLYHNPDNLFVAGFLGSPKMNFLDVEVQEVQGGAAVVASNLLEQQGDALLIKRHALAPGREELRGRADVLDYFSLLSAQLIGATVLDFGLSRPHLDDGVFRYKSKWGCRVLPVNGLKADICIIPQRRTEACLAFLRRNHFLQRRGDSLVVRAPAGEDGEARALADRLAGVQSLSGREVTG
jgi:multiple sugar transport system ATP-binding protein